MYTCEELRHGKKWLFQTSWTIIKLFVNVYARINQVPAQTLPFSKRTNQIIRSFLSLSTHWEIWCKDMLSCKLSCHLFSTSVFVMYCSRPKYEYVIEWINGLSFDSSKREKMICLKTIQAFFLFQLNRLLLLRIKRTSGS